MEKLYFSALIAHTEVGFYQIYLSYLCMQAANLFSLLEFHFFFGAYAHSHFIVNDYMMSFINFLWWLLPSASKPSMYVNTMTERLYLMLYFNKRKYSCVIRVYYVSANFFHDVCLYIHKWKKNLNNEYMKMLFIKPTHTHAFHL